MRASIILWLLLASSTAVAAEGQRIGVDLTDGSRVVGVTANKTLTIRTEFAEIAVPLSKIDRAQWHDDREHVTLYLQNADKLTGGIVPAPLKITTLFGEVTIDMRHVVGLRTLPPDASPPVIKDGLLLHLDFDEPPSPEGVVLNAAGDRHHGKLLGSAKWLQRGRWGGALQFTREHHGGVEIAADKDFDLQQMTLAAWVLPDQLTSSYHGVLAKTSPSSWSSGYGLVTLPGSSDLHFYVNYYSGETASKQLPNNKWTHVAATYDLETLRLYFNGQLVAERTLQRADDAGKVKTNEHPLLVGSAPSGYDWYGTIDDVMVYRRVLSDAEIARLYQATLLRAS